MSVTFPWYIRALNHAGRALDRLGLWRGQVEVEALYEAARKQTGFADFGPGSYDEALTCLVEAYASEARPTAMAKLTFAREATRLLAERLRIEATLTAHPEILQEEIKAPIFIIGYPRTGTTLLHNLLCADSQARVPYLYQAQAPAPHPQGEVARLNDSRRYVKLANTTMPDMSAVHPLRADWPEECLHFFNLCFASINFDVEYDLPTYQRYLATCDWEPHFQYHRRILQLLQWQNAKTGPWILKAPGHLLRLQALLKTYPDARVIWNHRDPVEVAASCCSLYEIPRTLLNKDVDPSALGHEWLRFWGDAMHRAMKDGEGIPARRRIDLPFHHLVADPVAAVGEIYRHFERPFSDEHAKGVQQWLVENPRQKGGRHRYTLQEYGLTAEMIRAALAPYYQRHQAHLAREAVE